MQIKSLYLPTVAALQPTLSAVVDSNFQPSIAIAFSWPGFPIASLQEACKTFRIELIGCTGSGEIVDGDLNEVGVSLMLLEVPAAYFSLVQKSFTTGGESELTQALGQTATTRFERPAILALASGMTTDGVSVVEGIHAGVGMDIPLFGGLAGDDSAKATTYVYTTEHIYEEGIVALVFDNDKVQLEGVAVGGWQPLGKVHQVSKTNGNLILEIDNEPALDLFLRYFGNVSFGATTVLADITPGQIPFKLFSGPEKGNMRSILRFNEEQRALLMAGRIEEGDKFKFCPIAKLDVLHKTINAFREHSETLDNPAGVILIQCKSRHYAFGPMLQDEVNGIYNIWQKPTIGFLSNGEFGPTQLGGRASFHNVTCSLVTIKESV